ncbi:MAG: biopolymer transporter ExbD [Planctomycetes bacterium]|nr:biopolymer transporter ExbD [Planctomycetota bacterium]MCW8134772.1 biopolymer transporter ExbD [Planctomycetota bacterium]
MAKVRKTGARSDKVEVDLTPMIDVVFLLIIFFLVVTQITTQENVNLRLPDALAANEEDPQSKRPFVIHIAPADQSSDAVLPEIFGYFCHGHPEPKNIKEMEGILQEQADRVDESADYTGRGPDGISENMIVVRCDARAPAQYFGQLIELMALIKIYKIKIAIMKDQEID